MDGKKRLGILFKGTEMMREKKRLEVSSDGHDADYREKLRSSCKHNYKHIYYVCIYHVYHVYYVYYAWVFPRPKSAFTR